jgi:hypothetical protein
VRTCTVCTCQVHTHTCTYVRQSQMRTTRMLARLFVYMCGCVSWTYSANPTHMHILHASTARQRIHTCVWANADTNGCMHALECVCSLACMCTSPQSYRTASNSPHSRNPCCMSHNLHPNTGRHAVRTCSHISAHARVCVFAHSTMHARIRADICICKVDSHTARGT